MTPQRHHDATLDEALDRRSTPRLRAGLAFALAAMVALLLVAYGVHVWLRQPAADQGTPGPPPPAARSPAGN